MRATLVLVLGLVLGCGLPLPDGLIYCADSEPSCPHGMSCAFDGRCWLAGHHPVSDLSAGTACAYAESCASGHCADGVCCNSPCQDQCTSCATADLPGTCVAIADGELSPEGHEPCPQGAICRVGRCVRKDVAEPCGVDLECESGACVDGVCCVRQCGRCEVCDAAGFVGACTPAPAGTDRHGDCASPTADALCQATCDGARNCLIPPGSCKHDCNSEASDHSPTVLPAASNRLDYACSAAGRCEFIAATTSCTTFQCDGDECRTSCTSGLDCNKSYRCASGVCSPGLNLGVPCAADLDCASAICDPSSKLCIDCANDSECTNGMFCTSAGGCLLAATCAQLDCAASGFGSSCDAASATCRALDPSECTNPGAPNDVDSLCVCAPNQGDTLGCRHGEVCSLGPAASAHCVGVAGRPCYADVVCASGKCVGHVCTTAAAGTYCRSGADCTSGVCAPTAASGGRPVCN